MGKRKIHKSVTLDRLERLFFKCREGAGVCFACGSTEYYTEPDAREYPCDRCGSDRVYGVDIAAHLLILEQYDSQSIANAINGDR